MSQISEIILEKAKKEIAWMIGYFFSKEKGAITELAETIRQIDDDILFLQATKGSAALLRELRRTAFAFDSRGRMYLEQRAKHPEKDQFYHGRYEETKEAQKIVEEIVWTLEQKMKKEPEKSELLEAVRTYLGEKI